jgi:hypothetical protein
MILIKHRIITSFFSCLLMVGACCAVAAQTSAGGAGRGDVVQESAEAELRLTTTILKHELSPGEHLRLTLGLHFINAGTLPLILYRHSSVVSRYTVSRTREGALAKKFIRDVSPLVMPIVPSPRTGETPDASLFVTLQPNESYVTETEVFLDLKADDEDQELRAGDYFLQVRVRTWYDPSELAMSQRKKWRPLGYLWSGAVTSSPMPFSIKP